jgi:hypothetical protein
MGWDRAQSYAGNDFWQMDYNPVEDGWEVTYSLPLDTPDDVRMAQEFRLVRDGA